MKGLLLAAVLCYTLTPSRARICAENNVGLATRRQRPWCEQRVLELSFGWDDNRESVERGRQAGLRRGIEELDRERNIVQMNITAQHQTPEFHHYLYDTPPPFFEQFFNKSTRDQYLAEEIGKTVVHQKNLPERMAGDMLTLLKIPAERDSCMPDPVCDRQARYRTIDGSCNNLQHPKWGMSGEAFTRLLPSVFGDGISSPRKSVKDGSPLPSERLLRTTLLKDRDVPSRKHTLIMMQWGQVIAHETLGTNDAACYGGMPCMCCTQDGKFLPKELVSRNCYVVEVPEDDYIYSESGKVCMSIQRSNATFALNCRVSASEDINGPTSYIDGSAVYGTSDEQAQQLRELSNGRMRVSRSSNRDMLPQYNDSYENCDVPAGEPCYIAGDLRVNQNPELAVLQTVLLRFHNDLANQLQQLNPSWNDERLYQEARRIVGSCMQHVTYNEMLPLYLGRRETLKYDLLSIKHGYSKGYQPKLNGMLINEMTGAAYRSAHGLAQGQLAFMDESRCPMGSTSMSNWFSKPLVIAEPSENFDKLLRGLTGQPAQTSDEYITEQLSNNMFRRNPFWGQDLASLDIARGRDRGIPPYNDYRELCGIRRARKFQDFEDLIPSKHVSKMAELYKDVDDVDLYIGGVLERVVEDSVFGPTFHCIVKEQFYRLKFGDRFWYQFKTSGLTKDQINEIRKVTISRIICDHGDNIKEIQPKSLEKISPNNPLMPCSNIPKMDLTSWKS